MKWRLPFRSFNVLGQSEIQELFKILYFPSRCLPGWNSAVELFSWVTTLYKSQPFHYKKIYTQLERNFCHYFTAVLHERGHLGFAFFYNFLKLPRQLFLELLQPLAFERHCSSKLITIHFFQLRLTLRDQILSSSVTRLDHCRCRNCKSTNIKDDRVVRVFG